jgi:hypothetical protein
METLNDSAFLAFNEMDIEQKIMARTSKFRTGKGRKQNKEEFQGCLPCFVLSSQFAYIIRNMENVDPDTVD